MKDWVVAKIEEIAEINPRLPKDALTGEIPVSFVPMAAVGAADGSIDVSNTRPYSNVQKGFTTFKEGDVLFAKITPCMENGKMAVVPEVMNGYGFGSTEFHVLRPLTGIEARYLYYYVSGKLFRQDAEHNMTGAVGQRRVPTPYLAASEIPIPPHKEQRRIVTKIEELFSELDKGIESFKTAREQLKVYRQALLKHAFEGKLTAAWREENKDKLETAEVLLKRIQAERSERYRQQVKAWEKAVKEWEKSGKVESKPGKPSHPKELPPLTADELAELPELPKGWGYTRIGGLIDDPTYGTAKKCDYQTIGIGVLRIPNVVLGKIDASDLKFALFSDEEISAYKLFAGDILMIRSNGSISIVGKGALVSERDINHLFAGYLIRIRPQKQHVKPEYLHNMLSLHSVRKQIEQKAKSTSGVNNINSVEIQSLVVAICNIEEQCQIVQELDSSLSEIHQLDQTITTALQQAETLRQSILKKAFSGQLVPQDPNDEPAAKLLERIKAERATVWAIPTGRPNSRTKNQGDPPGSPLRKPRKPRAKATK